MKLPAFNKKAAIVAAALGTLAVTNVATYKVSYSNGYKVSISESRKGYLKAPNASGVLTVTEEKGKKEYYFSEFESALQPDIIGAWNSDKNRKFLEWSITNNAKIDDKPVSYASAACVPQTTANFWDCSMRKLGESYSEHWRVEFDRFTGKWSA